MSRVLLLVKEQVGETSWPVVVAAWAAVGGALVAALAVWLQGRRMRLQIGMDNMWRLIEKWDSTEFRKRRSAAAEYLLDHFDGGPDAYPPMTVIDVLDLFELLAYLVYGSKTLSHGDAWTNFSGPAIQWWYACHPVITEIRAGDSTIYEDYLKLVKEFIREEEKRSGQTWDLLKPTDENLKEFLRTEISLAEKPPKRRPWLGQR